jgi:hypothetical protein
MKKKILGIALAFLASGIVFAQSFEIAAGLDIGGGKAVYEKDGNYTNPGVFDIGLNLQIGVMWEKIALLAEGGLAWVFGDDVSLLRWNAGGIFEFYPFIFENGETKLGIGLGVGYGSFLEDALYAKVEIPFIFSGGKIGINGGYYFLDNGPAFRVGLTYSVRGEQVVEFFNKQEVFPTK